MYCSMVSFLCWLRRLKRALSNTMLHPACQWSLNTPCDRCCSTRGCEEWFRFESSPRQYRSVLTCLGPCVSARSDASQYCWSSGFRKSKAGGRVSWKTFGIHWVRKFSWIPVIPSLCANWTKMAEMALSWSTDGNFVNNWRHRSCTERFSNNCWPWLRICSMWTSAR